MKNNSKLVLLSLISLFVLSACGNSNNPNNPSGDKGYPTGPTETVNNREEHLVDSSKQLHQFNVTPNPNRIFIKDDKCDYKIVLGHNNGNSMLGVNSLVAHIAEVTGVSISVFVDNNKDLKDDNSGALITYDKSSKLIVINHYVLEESAGATFKDDVNLELSGIMMKTVGDCVFIRTNSDYGYQTVCNDFMRAVFGYEWIAEDTYSYTLDGETLPDMDIIDKPDFDLSMANGDINKKSKINSNFTRNDLWVNNVNGEWCHTSFGFLDPEEYALPECSEKHLDCFSDEWAINKNYSLTNLPIQLCYTAHGNQAEYDWMINKLADNMFKQIQAYGDRSVITLTHQDYPEMCQCDTCKAAALYFGAESAAVMLLVNDVDDLIQAKLKEAGDTRDITVLFFAYHATRYAPVTGTNKSNYVASKYDGSPINYNGVDIRLPYKKTYPDGVRCNEHVGNFNAPIEAHFYKSLYDETSSVNTELRIELEKWGTLTNRVFSWVYDTNFKNYLLPYSSYDAILETARCLKENNSKFYFNQGQDGNREDGLRQLFTPSFGELKTYISNTACYDVNRSYQSCLDKFFPNFYGPASDTMLKFFTELEAYTKYQYLKYPDVFIGRINDPLTMQPTYWPYGLMKTWWEYCNKGLEEVEVLKASDLELYEKYSMHITLESLFARYMICQYYTGYYSTSALEAMRIKLKEDCEWIGVTSLREDDSITGVWSAWGI